MKAGFRLNLEKKETENKTIRFPVSLIDKIESILAGTELTFSSFVIQACKFAIENIEEEEKEKRNNPFKNKSCGRLTFSPSFDWCSHTVLAMLQATKQHP